MVAFELNVTNGPPLRQLADNWGPVVAESQKLSQVIGNYVYEERPLSFAAAVWSINATDTGPVHKQWSDLLAQNNR